MYIQNIFVYIKKMSFLMIYHILQLYYYYKFVVFVFLKFLF